jgi:ATP-binding cassette subfamily B protein
MNYKLIVTDTKKEQEKGVLGTALKRLVPLMSGEKKGVAIAFLATLVSAGASLLSPIIIAHVVDTYIAGHDMGGVVRFSLMLLGIYAVGSAASYVQIRTMGGTGRRILFNLRNSIFKKLSDLPVAFFNANKAGDVISRINNDTEKLNQFFAQALMQFLSNFILIAGAAVSVLLLNPKLGASALVPAAVVLGLTRLLSPWIRKTSLASLRAVGALSGEVSESLSNFKVIAAFNRGDYFREKFAEMNEKNYKASIRAGIASNTLTPLYTLASTAAQLIVLAYGLYLTAQGQFTVGLLIGFLLYVNNFYTPLRQLAAVWSSLQLALAGLDRISEVLSLVSDIRVVEGGEGAPNGSLLEFKGVSFGYEGGKVVLHDVNFSLEKGKTYALVGPTGGGKTTTASLMARLYDPTGGSVYLNGRDIRSYTPAQRAKKIGFILQEPFLFSGTVRENILYGNEEYKDHSNEEIIELLGKSGLALLLTRFSEGLDTKIKSTGESVSLGQKQLIAFMRAVLRGPELLILDEATANIDTVTEDLLEDILKKLPASTTRVIIAHRLNTIENADEIFFVNGGTVTQAGDFNHAVEMLLHGKRES